MKRLGIALAVIAAFCLVAVYGMNRVRPVRRGAESAPEVSARRRFEHRPALKIPGAKVERDVDASRLAEDNYIEKGKGFLANESSDSVYIIKLGCDVKDFGRRGDLIWEVQILNNGDELRSIIWVHPQSSQVHFVFGPWMYK